MKRSILLYPILLFILPFQTILSQKAEKKQWLGYYNLSLKTFLNPSLDFAPFTRWWWPGNDVTPEELKREVNLFADHHFGGVEIQPMALVFPTKGAGRADRIMSWDTPAYYENLRAVFEEARKRGITVDMTDGSGWPAGGPHLTEADNNKTMQYGLRDIPMGNKSAIKVPRAVRGDRPTAKLIALLAARVIQDTTSSNKTFRLDPKSIINITSKVKDSSFVFTPSGSSWKAIAIWSMADMETPMLMAKRDAGFAMNHFDSTKVFKNYNYYFGERTGMAPYFGNPMRCIFDDSYEFRADRHFSDDFISTFKAKRGYDVTPYLPANMWQGYNNMYTRMQKPGLKPDFAFTDEDWRLRYEYDLTLSDVIRKQFLKATRNWTETKGLLHRTQPYGLNMDIMAAAGDASIPEVETMQFNKGTEGGYKLITSGAHIYNRPVISCEAAVYINRAFMTTPQKLKMTIDKVLSSGVNQIIWHGTAYNYHPDGYPKEGWFPFFNSALGINFSSDLNESNPFWKYMSGVNQYAQRAQYVLRSGKPHADVLIYYPFLNYSEETFNPKETLLNGYIKDVEPPLPAENVTASYNRKIDTEWLNEIWPLINELNAKGITWDWVNDASIQTMSVTPDKKLNVRGNIYQSVVLFDLPYIQLKSAQQLAKLSNSGANILAVGKLPTMQPGYNNYKVNDLMTAKAMLSAVNSPTATRVESVTGINSWSSKLSLPVKCIAENVNLRHVRRVMNDGSLSQFIWNESDSWQTVVVKLANNFKAASWMNAEDGSTVSAAINPDHVVKYKLAPYSSIFLYASTTPQTEVLQKGSVRFDPSNATILTQINKWNIQSDSIVIRDSGLFDWKNNELLKYSSKEGVYTARFTVGQIDSNASYFIDLGKVYFSADVSVNGKAVGSRIYSPFVLDLTPYLKVGENEIKVTVTPTKYNEFVGEALKGNKLYKRLKDSELMSQGLVGPVNIYEQKNR
ncbi:MAG: glycosyl hydrolase [Bacteroidota bacterium]|nr:glycosyl hydrolase [Bacteroidota bacterium]